ncbi:putative MFS-type transporter [Erysiphe neolycopersici]|uniref:Putative MFS-type transporter n=1 Tax=Erysiphe neolycopersici TaxID=212602 RepID=A0A420H9S4_9PEZI|nr:putative MFS-type transporter [Erysiphe neolycopersici]
MDAIMEEIKLIPGTERIFHRNADCEGNFFRSEVIDLLPQLSSSSNDPLNWSLLRKLWHTFLLLFITGLTSASTNSTWLAQEAMFNEYNISFGKVDFGSAVLFMGIGLGTFLLSPIAFLYGRRLPYLIYILMSIIGMLWMLFERTRQDSIWNQLFVGASGAVVEANVQLSLSDIWVGSHRGSALGLYVLVTSIGTFLGPFVNSFVLQYMGWRWIPQLSIIIFSILLLVFYFGLEETLYHRPVRRKGSASSDRSVFSSHSRISTEFLKSSRDEQCKERDHVRANTYSDTTQPYLERIRLVTYAPNLVGYGLRQYRDRLLKTLQVFVFPAVFYSGIQWGAQDAWVNFYLKIQQDDWMEAPYNFTQFQSGLMNIPTIIGAIIGCFWGGYLSDYFVVYMAKRRDGISEAEDLLWMMLPCLIFSPLGLLIFGIGTADSWNYYWSFTGLGLIGFGWGCAGDLSLSYLMQAYPDMVLEGMVGVSLINNGVGGLSSLVCIYWFDVSGVRDCIIGVSCLSFFFLFLTIPMMIWGKDCRHWSCKRYQEFVRSRDAI